jgi:hypothetical protein
VKLFPKTVAALTLLSVLAGPSLAATTMFKGSYTVHYLSGPSHAETNDICVFFKHTGAIDGFPDSGIWSAKTPEGLQKGNFVVDTGILRFYGTFNKNKNATNNYVAVSTGAGGFDVWDISAIPVTPEQDGIIQIAKGC